MDRYRGDLGDPDDPRPVRPPATPERQAWLLLRACATMVLGLAVSVFSFMRHLPAGCLLGSVILVGGLLLTYSKAIGVRHRFGVGPS